MIEKLVPAGATVFAFSNPAEAYTSRNIVIAYQSAFGNTLEDIFLTPLVSGDGPRWLLRFRYPAAPLRQLRVVQTAPGGPDHWSVSELRIFRGAAELPRAPGWKLRASPNPWAVQLAFDNSPVTRWRSWSTLYPGMYVAAEFASPEVSDSVLLECTHDQYKVRLKLEGLDQAGSWKLLSDAPAGSDGPRQFGLRRLATQELKSRGVDYLFLVDTDFAAEDVRTKSGLWGVTQLGEHNRTRLYRID